MKRVLVGLATLARACSASPTATGPPGLVLSEFAVEASGVFAPGVSDVIVRNQGEFGHTVVVADSSGKVITASAVVPPGEELLVTVDLAPGSYEFSCRIVVQTGEGDLVDHYEEGMDAHVEVAASP